MLSRSADAKLHDSVQGKGIEMRRFTVVFAAAALASLGFNNASADDRLPLWSTANLSQARIYT